LAAFTFDEDDEDELAHSPVTDIVSLYARILRACIDAYGHGNISVFSVTLQVEFMKQTVGKDVDNVNKHEVRSSHVSILSLQLSIFSELLVVSSC